MAPVMLPYLADRPVNLHRFPDGIDKPGFWHKALPAHAPDWLRRWRNEDADPGETELYLVLDSPAALAWAANYGAIELHPWTSTVGRAPPADVGDDRHRPGHRRAASTTCSCSPASTAPPSSTSASRRVPKVTGKRGIQIWVPVADAVHVRRHAAPGSRRCRVRSATPCPTW